MSGRRRWPGACRALAAATVAVVAGSAVGPAAAAAAAVAAARPVAPPAPAVSGVTGAGGVAGSGTVAPASFADASASAPHSSGDPLTENGFGSVLCRDATLEGSLNAAARGNCATSSFVAAAAPTGNYAFDVHIDTGLLSVPLANLVATCIQDFVLVPVWTALVWIVHALLVGIEWCYTLNLLDAATLGGVASALRSVQETLTQPLLAFALATAAVLALYHGLVRRRVAQTLAEVLVMFAMMAAGLWVVLDPVDTIGTVGSWSDQTSLGVFAAVTDGEPGGGAASLAGGTSELFATAIGGPWCYLEFGNVDWCRDGGRLDPRLRAAADAIAAQARGSSSATQRTAATLITRAQTNGDLFLSLPANGPQRNSINDSGSLLHTLCDSSDATNCSGPTASEAEFRTAGGTLPRAGGLLLVVIGASGMIAVLTFIVARLLGAALATLLYLLLAPVFVLAPAFGEGGRAAFRSWATRLLGALLAKLVYSLVLGIVLLILRVVEGLSTLGWWTQWLLVTCLWWTTFHRRHQLIEYISAPRSDITVPRSRRARAIRAGSTLLYGRELRRLLRDSRGERLPPEVGRRPPRGPVSDGGPAPGDGDGRGPNGGDAPRRPGDAPRPRPGGDGGAANPSGSVIDQDDQPDRTTRAGGRATVAPVAPVAPVAAQSLGERDDARTGAETGTQQQRGEGGPDAGPAGVRLARLEREHARALAAGDKRRAAGLQRRAGDLRGRLTARAEARGSGDAPLGERLLDEQTRLPAARQPRPPGVPRRDYAALAPLAGMPPGAYAVLSAAEQRKARLAIDRELDARRRPGGPWPGPAHGADSTHPAVPRSAPPPPGFDASLANSRSPAAPVRAPEAPADEREPIGGRRSHGAAAGSPDRALRHVDDSVVIRRERQFAQAHANAREHRQDAPRGGDAPGGTR